MTEDSSDGEYLFQISIPKISVTIAVSIIIEVFFVMTVFLIYIYYHTYFKNANSLNSGKNHTMMSMKIRKTLEALKKHIASYIWLDDCAG